MPPENVSAETIPPAEAAPHDPQSPQNSPAVGGESIGDARVWDDQKTEALMGNLLRAGVTVSACVAGLGGVLYLLQNGRDAPHHALFRGEPADLRSIPGIVRECFKGSSRGIIQFGILLLIATPVARVAFAVYAFGREKDRLYVVISLIVLIVLLYGLISPYL